MYRVLSCLTTQHDWRLVALAAVVCYLGSLAAVSLFHRARATHGRTRVVWILTAGTAAGSGIWATHFVAMLAYDPGVAIMFEIDRTALSLLAAIVVTTGGLAFAVNGATRWAAAVGGGVVGAGVAAMHYLGMAAIDVAGYVIWSWDLVAASIVLGLLFGAAAFAIAIRYEEFYGTVAAAVLLTLAIVSHHFTAMGAVGIIPDVMRLSDSSPLSPLFLALAIASVAVAVLGMSLVGAFADRRLAERTHQFDLVVDQFTHERKQLIATSEEKLREQNLLLDAALNNMSQGLLMFDAAGRLVFCNQSYIQMYRLSPEMVKPGCTLRDLFVLRLAAGTFHGDPDRFAATLDASRFTNGQVDSKVMELPDGRAISITNRPMANGGWVSTHDDITTRRQAGRELDRTKTFLNTVIENVPVTIVVKDASEFRYILINRAGEEFYGVPRNSMLGKTAYDVLSKEAADLVTKLDKQLLETRGQSVFDEHVLQTPGHGPRTAMSTRLPIFDEKGEPQYLLAVVDDVTERKQAEARIAYMAHHDDLTNLPNRAAFNERLAMCLQEAEAAGESFGIVCIDFDRFKEVNDVFGHSVGDGLLCEVSSRLKTATSDVFLARLGGDEFTMISTGGPQPATAAALAENLLNAVAEEVEIEGHRLKIGISIGVAIFPTDGNDATTLLGNADAALYRAKAEGRGAIRFFEADMDLQLRERRALQHDLRSAIERSELHLHYQPQARMGGEISGFEALIRWKHPVRGMVPPNVFIPIAEESSLIIEIGEWVLREACREAASWPRPLQVAVNLSPVQFRHGDLPTLVHSILLETGLSASRLELEITESVLIGDLPRAVSILRRLKSLGVRIAMDDFGTGYSSLSYLQSFPFDKIKIDRSFISNLDRNPQSAAIIRAVIGLGRGLDLPVVAEGVETKDQLAFLSRESCDEIQGFLVGRPCPIEDYAAEVGRPPAIKKTYAATA